MKVFLSLVKSNPFIDTSMYANPLFNRRLGDIVHLTCSELTYVSGTTKSPTRHADTFVEKNAKP